MRQKIVAGNWKMNTLIEEGAALAKNIADRINEVPSDVQLILAPPFTHLDRVGGIIKGTPAALSAQNCAPSRHRTALTRRKAPTPERYLLQC